MEWDKQQTNNSACEINNPLKKMDNEKRKGLFEISKLHIKEYEYHKQRTLIKS